MADSPVRGRFVWYELMTGDAEAAIRFYTALIGWGTQAFEGGPGPYTMWTVEGAPVGGVMTLPEEAAKAGAQPHWMAYIGTPDVDASIADVKRLGGDVRVEPEEIPEVGRFAGVADPQGAAFSLFTPAQEPPAEIPEPGVGQVSWHELATIDWQAAFEFYRTLCGWEKTEAMDLGEMGTYQMFGLGGRTFGAMFTKPAEMPGPPFWLLYTMVPSADDGAEKVKELGGQDLNGPMEVPGGDRIVQCLDPQGAAFALHSRAAS